MSTTLPTCPDNCDVTNLPAVSFSDCAPEVNSGQLYNLYVGNINQPFVDVEDPLEWAGRLSDSDTGLNKIRRLTIIGGKPLPEKQEKTISHGRIIQGVKKHTINWKIDETNDINYNFMLGLECGGTFAIWYEDSAGYLYGGNSGIKASLALDHEIPEDTAANQTFTGTAKWESKFHPNRVASPIAGV